MTETEEISVVLEELQAAFGDLPIPARDHLVYDNSGSHLECNHVLSKLQGRHWQDLSAEDLAGEADALWFLTSEGFRFFLPAFVRVSLVDPDRADLIPDAILSSLAEPEPPEHRKKQAKSVLDRHQVSGVLARVISDIDTDAEAIGSCDEFRRGRLEILSAAQKRAILSFIGFLKRYRAAEFPHGELERAEGSLTS
jgi:hypothetical protein